MAMAHDTDKAQHSIGVYRLDQEETAQVGGGDQEMKVLKEMNAFEDDHERFMDSLKGA